MSDRKPAVTRVERDDGPMDAASTSDPRLDAAVRASAAWYEDVFRVHRIPARREGGLWSALAEPPRWHSAAKTLHPDVPTAQVLDAVTAFERCSVADSFATLDLADHGFQRLFRATWLHRAASATVTARRWPPGWSVVSDDEELAVWNTAQDTTGVLVPALLHHPRFTFLVRRSAGKPVAGAVLHRVDDVVELSNTWALGDESEEVSSMLECAETLHPAVAVVGYWRDDELMPYTDAGFRAVGPHVVWLRGS